MPKYTAHEAQAARFTLLANDVTATSSGASVNTGGTHGECLVVLSYGTCSGTGSSTIKMQESSDDVTFSDITSATFGAKTTATDETIYTARIDLKKRSKFIKAFETIAGSFKSKRSVSLIMRPNHKRPASQTNTNAFSV